MIRRFLILACCLVPTLLSAQQPRAVVEFDHLTGRARLITTRGEQSDTTDAGDSPTVRLNHDTRIEVRVVNTNTALYQYDSKSTSTPLPETEAVQAVMGKLGPYVPELKKAILGGLRARGAADAAEVAAVRKALSESMAKMRAGLLRLDETLYGRGGLQDAITTSLLALERMRRGDAPEAASEPLRRTFSLGAPCAGTNPVELPAAHNLLNALSTLVQAAQEVQLSSRAASLLDEPVLFALRDSVETVEQRAQAALRDFEPLVANAYRVEKLVGLVAGACSQWSAGEVTLTRTSGRTVTITVAPRGEPETARVARRSPATYTVEVQPRALFRPAIALTAVAAPGARFPRYATRPAGDSLEIYESGLRDARFGAGATLSFTWPGLDYRDTRGFAVWLPELVITAGRSPAVGVGTSISWSFVKAGAGALWIRRPALHGMRTGDVIAIGEEPVLADVYGAPELFFSISVFDWAPFAKRLSRD